MGYTLGNSASALNSSFGSGLGARTSYGFGTMGGSGNGSGTSSTAPAYDIGPPNFNTYMAEHQVPDFSQTQQGYKRLMKQSGGMFDSSGYMNQVNNLSDYALAAGMNSANAAARQYSQTAQRTGTSGAGAGVARALSMMPALQQSSQLRLQGQEFASAQNAARAAYMAQLQSGLAGAQQDYRGMLADYNQGMFGIQNQNAQWQSGLTENRRQFDAEQQRLREAQRQQAALQEQQLSIDAFNARQPVMGVSQHNNQGMPTGMMTGNLGLQPISTYQNTPYTYPRGF